MVNWHQVILDLIRAGMSQTSIAREIGCDQGTIGRLYRQETFRVEFENGIKLLDLHLDHCPNNKLELNE